MVQKGESGRSLKWTVRPKVDGHLSQSGRSGTIVDGLLTEVDGHGSK